MGFPHPTYDVPGQHEDLARLVEGVLVDPLGHGRLLVSGLRGGDVAAGHLCATAWVLDPSGTQTLLVRHPILGWVEPGGHVELGEAPAAAAARELAEETGITAAPAFAVPALVHAATFPAARGHPAHEHWNLGYLFRVDPDVALVAEPDAPAAWFPVDELPEPAVPDLAVVLPVLAEVVRQRRPQRP